MNKKGYTLVELLFTGTIIAIIAVITVPNIIGIYKKTKTNEYNRYLNDIFLSTEAYVQKYIKRYPELKEVNGTVYIYFDQLINSGFLKSTTYDTKNKKMVRDEDFTVQITLNSDLEYEYKLFEEKKQLCPNNKCENGTPIYFNPETGTKCFNYNEENSKLGIKSGCMKWYTFNDSSESTTVDIILDHNTTATVAWNSTGTNTEMKEVKTVLTSDTNAWKTELKPRMINADEIAKITGNTTFNSSSATIDGWFYFDSNNQTPTAIGKGTSKYSWLYNYTSDCLDNGCMIDEPNTYGYWTTSPIYSISSHAWRICGIGNMTRLNTDHSSHTGIRPVITVSKDIILKNT